MTLIPLGDHIVVRPEPNPEMTDSGLHLVEHRKPETQGTVIAIPERVPARCPECDTRCWIPPSVKVGDQVLFSWESGLEVYVDEARCLLIREPDLVAVLEAV